MPKPQFDDFRVKLHFKKKYVQYYEIFAKRPKCRCVTVHGVLKTICCKRSINPICKIVVKAGRLCRGR